MRIGIDWVSAAIFVAAFVFSQFRFVPVRGRYGVLALACGAIAAYRMRMGSVGPNLVFVGLAAALAVYYAFRAFRVGSRGA